MRFPIKIKDITSNKGGKKLLHRLNNNDPSLTKYRLINVQQTYPDSHDEWAFLGHMIGKNKQVDTIDLCMRHRKKTKTQCIPFYEGLQHNRSIKSFHLGCFDLRPWNSIINNLCSFIKNNQNLTDLSFARCHVGRGSARLLSSALRCRENKSLTRFEMSDGDMTNESFTDILEAVSLHTKLECLDLGEFYYSIVEMARILSKASLKGLQHLILYNSGIDDVSCTALSLAIANKPELKSLILTENSIGIQGIRSLVAALTNCSKLETLKLGSNNISDEAVETLLPALSGMKHLRVLDLSSNILTTLRGFEVISDCKDLDDLDLCGNNLNDEGIDILVCALKCLSLLKLNLSYNDGISSEGSKLVSTLLDNPFCKLEELRVDRDNFVEDEELATYANALINNDTLKVLGLGRSFEGWEAFSALLCNCSSVESTYLSNHMLSSLGFYRPPRQDFENQMRYLEMNQNTNKKQVAMRKIILVHDDIDMQPFFKYDLKMLPLMMKWLETAADIPMDFETHIDERKLSSIFQFVQNVSWLCTM